MIEYWGIPAALPASLLLGVAAGLDIYFTLLLLAAAPLLGWEGAVPQELLSGLSSPLGIGIAAGFYVLEFAAERVRPVGLFWHLAQTLVRPVAAGLLAYVVLEMGAPEWSPWSWALGAAALSLLTHAVKTGTSLLIWISAAPTPSNLLLSVAEDVITVGLVALALDTPHVGLLVVGGVLALLATLAPSAIRASFFGHYLAWCRSWGSLRSFRWTEEGLLPPRLRGAVQEVERPLGQTFSAARCGVFQGPGSGAFRTGWLVCGPRRPLVVFERLRRARLVQLLTAERVDIIPGPLFVRVRVPGVRPFSLVFPKSGPSEPVLESRLLRSAARDRRNPLEQRV